MNVVDVLASCAVAGAVAGGLRGLAGRPPSRPRSRLPVRDVLVLVLGAASGTSAIVIVHAPAALRIPVAAVAVLLAPGFSIVVFRRLGDLLDEVALALALSFAVLVLLGTLMVSVRWWDPVVVAAVLGIVTAPILTCHGVLGLRSPVPDGAGGADG